MEARQDLPVPDRGPHVTVMAAYRDSIPRAPKRLTDREVTLLLKVTGSHVDGFRDHVLYGLTFSTGLRQHESLALDVGDVRGSDGRIRRRVRLRVWKGQRDDEVEDDRQEVFLNNTIRAKLARLLDNRRRDEGPLADDEPLFVSSRGVRLSARRARSAFAEWQVKAGFERHINFHAMRHTATDGVYRRTKDIRLAQRFARHESLHSTTIYTHPSDDDLERAVEGQPA